MATRQDFYARGPYGHRSTIYGLPVYILPGRLSLNGRKFSIMTGIFLGGMRRRFALFYTVHDNASTPI